LIGFEGINFRIWFQRACKDSGRVSDIGPDIENIAVLKKLRLSPNQIPERIFK